MTKKFYSSEGSSGTSLLRDAHERLEAMIGSRVCWCVVRIFQAQDIHASSAEI